MNQNNLPEIPLFPDEDTPENGKVSAVEPLSLEEYKIKQELSRQNKVLDFCFKSSKWIAILAVALILADIITKCNGVESSLIKECFSLITYIVTAALGFIFANNSK